jgi:hypothetical protein
MDCSGYPFHGLGWESACLWDGPMRNKCRADALDQGMIHTRSPR